MSQFKLMKTSTLIICQVLLENILDKVYEVLVIVILKLHSDLCCRNTRCSQQKIYQVLQVLAIFEIWIFRIFEFSGRQKWTALAASDRQSMLGM